MNVEKSAVTTLLIAMARLLKTLTGVWVPPTEPSHHHATFESEVRRIATWIDTFRQTLEDRQVKQVDQLPRMVVNCDGEVVPSGSEKDDRTW